MEWAYSYNPAARTGQAECSPHSTMVWYGIVEFNVPLDTV